MIEMKLLSFPLLAAVLLTASCGSSHFLEEKTYRNQVRKDYEARMASLPAAFRTGMPR